MNAFLPGFTAAGSFPVSNRKTSDDFISTEVIGGFKPELAKGLGSIETLISNEGDFDSIEPLDSQRLPEGQRDIPLTPCDTTSCRAEVHRDSDRPLSMRAVAFRVSAFARTLSRQERAAVAARRRFYSMPYLHRADEPSDDFLP